MLDHLPLSVITGADEAVVWLISGITLVLLISPALIFLFHGWESRKEAILSGFSPHAAELYLKCFHPAELFSTEKDARAQLKSFYHRQFGRRLFVLPLILCTSAAGALLFLCTLTALEWLRNKTLTGGIIPLQVVLAILGGCLWVANDQISRSYHSDMSPGDLYWASFRLLVSVPVAYSFSQVVPGNTSTVMAFLLGTFPTSTIMTISRRMMAKYFQLTDAGTAQQTELQKLSGIDTLVAERLAAEGITTIRQLAYYDPVKLAIRTGLGFSYIISCEGEALLYNCVEDKINALRPFGLAGSYECRALWEDLKKPEWKDASTSIVRSAAAAVGVTPEGFINVLAQVGLDPYSDFQWEAWADSMGTPGLVTAPTATTSNPPGNVSTTPDVPSEPSIAAAAAAASAPIVTDTQSAAINPGTSITPATVNAPVTAATAPIISPSSVTDAAGVTNTVFATDPPSSPHGSAAS